MTVSANTAISSPSGARIVIVDDDPGVRELLTEFLVENGFGAEAVANGAACATGWSGANAT